MRRSTPARIPGSGADNPGRASHRVGRRSQRLQGPIQGHRGPRSFGGQGGRSQGSGGRRRGAAAAVAQHPEDTSRRQVPVERYPHTRTGQWRRRLLGRIR